MADTRYGATATSSLRKSRRSGRSPHASFTTASCAWLHGEGVPQPHWDETRNPPAGLLIRLADTSGARSAG